MVGASVLCIACLWSFQPTNSNLAVPASIDTRVSCCAPTKLDVLFLDAGMCHSSCSYGKIKQLSGFYSVHTQRERQAQKQGKGAYRWLGDLAHVLQYIGKVHEGSCKTSGLFWCRHYSTCYWSFQ